MLNYMVENKRILNLHEQKFVELVVFQANTTVFQANTNASLKNLETQVRHVKPQKYPKIFIIISLYILGMNRAKLGFFREN